MPENNGLCKKLLITRGHRHVQLIFLQTFSKSETTTHCNQILPKKEQTGYQLKQFWYSCFSVSTWAGSRIHVFQASRRRIDDLRDPAPLQPDHGKRCDSTPNKGEYSHTTANAPTALKMKGNTARPWPALRLHSK